MHARPNHATIPRAAILPRFSFRRVLSRRRWRGQISQEQALLTHLLLLLAVPAEDDAENNECGLMCSA